MRFGLQNTAGAPAVFGARGAVSWSIELPIRQAPNLLAARNQHWVASARSFLAVGDASGVRWRRDRPCYEPALFELDGRVHVALPSHEDGLTAVELDGGAVRWTRAGSYAFLAVVAGQRLAAVDYSQDARALVLLDPDGALRWSKPADGAAAGLPLAFGDLVVYAARQEVKAFTVDGELAWQASPDGFQQPAASAKHHFTTSPFALDARRVAVGAEAQGWSSFVVLDPEAQQARPMILPNGSMVTDTLPFALRQVHGLPLAIAIAPLWNLQLIALDGSSFFQVEFSSRPYAFAFDATGAIAIAHTYDTDYYDRNKWHDGGRRLLGRCRVAVLEPDGRQRWSWEAPGPLAGFAVSSTGEILVTSEGRLWAIA